MKRFFDDLCIVWNSFSGETKKILTILITGNSGIQ
jgi:hypothetical protein